MAGPTYQIVVGCRLGNEWNERLGNLKIKDVWQSGESARTVIRGRPRDRSELLGIIQNLYDHGAPIISISELEDLDSETIEH